MAKRLSAILLVAALAPIGTAAALEWSEPTAVDFLRHESSDESGHFDRTFDVSVFLKGNLHAHTERSDGDSSPEEVIAWYRQHGYAFLALTDHNRFADPERWAWLQDDSFRVLSGEEVSLIGGGRQVHMNALCTAHRIGGGTFLSAAEALAWATEQIVAQGGVAIVNHPNFDRALVLDDLVVAERASLLEIMSGHPYVFSEGVGDRPSAEALWDSALRGGAKFMGVAVDDMHHLRVTADPPAFPGRGWVEVFGSRDDSDVICSALRQGLLYSSTGVTLRRIRVTRDTYAVWVETPDAEVSFIGSDGRTLFRSRVAESNKPVSYMLRGEEKYVRARIRVRDGTLAWTPPVFVERANGQNPAGSASRLDQR